MSVTKVSYTTNPQPTARNVAKVSRMCSTISTSPYWFKGGRTMTPAKLVQLFSWLTPNISYNTVPPMTIQDGLKYRNLYCQANAVLAERGIRIKSKNYYEQFTVQDAPAVTAQISTYARLAGVNDAASDTLAVGLVKGLNKWRTLTKVERVRAAARLTYN